MYPYLGQPLSQITHYSFMKCLISTNPKLSAVKLLLLGCQHFTAEMATNTITFTLFMTV